MHGLGMVTKPISLELDAYEKLKRAKKSPRESFSSVVRRGKWEEIGYTGQEVLKFLKELRQNQPDSFLTEEDLNRIDENKGLRSIRNRTKWEE